MLTLSFLQNPDSSNEIISNDNMQMSIIVILFAIKGRGGRHDLWCFICCTMDDRL